jgi:hypothetical protein
MKTSLLSITLAACTTLSLWAVPKAAQDSLTWFDGTHPVSYYIESETDLVVGTALEMFRSDMQLVTGREAVAGDRQATLRLLQLDHATPRQLKQWRRAGIRVDSLLARPDAFQVVAHEGQLWLAGGNGRGVAYAVLELSREAGVSPWVWWGDVVPEGRSRLTVPAEWERYEAPAVTYRGIFINDEDWSTRPWSQKTFDPTETKGLISARTYKEIFKLLLRLRGNLIWPAMHEGSVPFYAVPGARAVADSCGIVVGTSHCEPLMRNNVGEWREQERGRYNYLTNRESVLCYWSERLQESGHDENIYTIGMRGIHDGPMEGVKGLGPQTEALQAVIDDQRALLSRYVNKEVTAVPQIFVPYKEVLQVLENGLQVPENVTLVWCDDNYGYLTRLPDSLQQQRRGGHGLYYHLSYWGRPHDYLWLSCTQPGLIYEELTEAYRRGVRRLWVANVHDPKVAAYPLELFMDLAWDVECTSDSTLQERQVAWLSRMFGPELGGKLGVLNEFYRQVGIRRPEFMGWCQNELDKKVYPRGLSPVQDTEFSFTEYGDAADRYLAAWRLLRDSVMSLRAEVPERLQDAYFAHVLYPTCAAADMSIKLLEAQRARLLAGLSDSVRLDLDSSPETCDAGLREAALRDACGASLAAHHEVERLTRYYNDTLAGGKWRYLMDARPRTQLVFEAPTLPACSGVDSARASVVAAVATDFTLNCLHPDTCTTNYIARNAADYQLSSGHVQVIQQLGHSLEAVAVERGGVLAYEVSVPDSCDVTLMVALIPTHPLDRGDLRLGVRLDEGAQQVVSIREGFRTEPWKLNVLRGQALRTVPIHFTPGTHTLRLEALDDHVVVDQWFLDLSGMGRTPYPVPVK